MKRTLVASAVVAAAAGVASGCGGSSAAQAPAEDPGQVMKAVIRHELSGYGVENTSRQPVALAAIMRPSQARIAASSA